MLDPGYDINEAIKKHIYACVMKKGLGKNKSKNIISSFRKLIYAWGYEPMTR